MTIIHGKSASSGVAFGKILFYKPETKKTERVSIHDTGAELQRLETAKATALAQLDALYEKTLKELGEPEALLFQIHQMMLEDLDYCESIEEIITGEHLNAEYAVSETGKKFARMFAESGDAYMQARASDVKDISRRLVRALTGEAQKMFTISEPVIVAADDLTPSETVQLDKQKVLAFITAAGSTNSHTAILARTMGIPAVVGLGGGVRDAIDGLFAIVDGETGEVYLEPDRETIAKLEQKRDKEAADKSLLNDLKGKPNITLDGHEIDVYANIASPSDMESVLKSDAGGIGLFRSEFLYLGQNDYPTEDEQFHAYKTVAEQMNGKRVIIRTLDIGADKQADYFDLPKEENPAMGMRAIRICLTQPEILRTQLRALYRASAFGRIAVMFPMITSLSEVHDVKKIAAGVRDELTRKGIPYSSNVELGIMVETPAAAIISDLLAKEVDFFSVGTNDLTQYTLAMDRQNQSLEPFLDIRHAAVLRLIQMTVENAHKSGIWAGICGELAADLSLTGMFLAMGVDELSVSPHCVLPLRAKIRKTDTRDVNMPV